LGNDPAYKNMGNEVWEKIIKDADVNGDGVIDYNEFILLMQKLKSWCKRWCVKINNYSILSFKWKLFHN